MSEHFTALKGTHYHPVQRCAQWNGQNTGKTLPSHRCTVVSLYKFDGCEHTRKSFFFLRCYINVCDGVRNAYGGELTCLFHFRLNEKLYLYNFSNTSIRSW